MGKVTGRIDDEGIARAVLQAASELRAEMTKVKLEVGQDAEIIFAAYAPKGTGRLSRGIKATVAGDEVIVRADAQNPKTGYDYVGVTRFGHKLQRLTPRHAPKAARLYPKTAKAFPLPFGFRRWIHGFAALSTPFGFRRSVRGFHPSKDWAAEALPEVQKEADRAMQSFGHGFLARIA